jgi:hypothetical protein
MKEPSQDMPDPAWGPPPLQPSARQLGELDGRQPRPHRHRAGRPANGGLGGAEGNERLTALTGTVLLVLLAAEGVTILSLGRLLTLHFFIGMMLLGPVALKAGSTVYRFVRYYTGSAPYRRKGPPAPLLRLLGPLVIASTAGVFGSGVALALAGPGNGPWLFLHKASFAVWFCVMTAHVLVYLPRLPRLLTAELRGRAGGYGPTGDYDPAGGYGPAGGYAPAGEYGRVGGYGRAPRVAAVLGGRGMRLSLLIASLLAGLVIAALTVHLAAPWHFANFGR